MHQAQIRGESFDVTPFPSELKFLKLVQNLKYLC